MSLSECKARDHVLGLEILVGTTVLLMLFVVGPVLGDLRERATRAERRLYEDEVQLECLTDNTLSPAYRKAICK